MNINQYSAYTVIVRDIDGEWIETKPCDSWEEALAYCEIQTNKGLFTTIRGWR